MANPSKAKGTAAEVAVRDYLRRAGYPAERLPTEGAKDRGDIVGIPGITIEVKACREMALAQWVDEANAEADNAGQGVAVVWHKRRGTTDPGRWYVTLEGADFLTLLEAIGDGWLTT